MTRWHLAAENDYRGIEPVPGATPRVAVVIPVYNRVALLARTVAGLVHQRYDGELQVVVADDGSDEDVKAALAPLEDRLDLTVVRREHEGYGAGQARNLGARTADAEVVVFIDADCVPDAELVARHAAWHTAADNLVVIGSRHPLDTSEVTVERLLAGDLDLRALAGLRAPDRDGAADGPGDDGDDGDDVGTPAEVPGAELMPSDWRRLLYRRTARLRRGDEAYRSLVSSNFSVRRDRFLEVGGFDEEFSRWGGEDTELGWRLALAGLFHVPEDRAINYHQIQEDAGPEAWREQERAKNDGIIRAKIPHRFYRSESRPGIVYQVPKVSVIAGPVTDRRADALVADLLRQNLTDWKATLLGDGDGLRRLGEELIGDPRFEVAPTDGDLEAAVLAASRRATGEYVCYLDGDASLDHRALARAAKDLDRNPRRGRVSVGYRLPAPEGPAGGDDAPARPPTDLRRHEDVVALDARYGMGPLPAFALVRRRDVGKALGVAADLGQLWATVEQVAGWSHLSQPLVGLPLTPEGEPPTFRSARSMLVEDLRRSRDPRAMARATARAVRARRGGTGHSSGRPTVRPSLPGTATGERGAARPASEEPIPLRYVGWVGHDNFGDEILLRAVRELLPWASIETTGAPARCVLLGGGTLINRGYLRQLDRVDSPRIERAVFGTGVANPEYWGEPREDPREWVEFLSTCAVVGVRGPISEELLRGWGYQGPLEVIGDPALAIERPDVARVDGRVVVSLAQARGELWGGDDDAVFATIAQAVERLLADGREVHLLAASPRDDLAGIQVMRAAGAPDLPYLAAYRDQQAALELLASASVVIGERLHAVVLAAACDTPFVALEYRPKLRDFARSVGAGDQVIRTDQLDTDGLLRAVAATDARADELRGTVAEHVQRYRHRLAAAGEQLREALR